MATDPRESNHIPGLTTRRYNIARHREPTRRLSASRRAAGNVESFHRNRANRIRTRSDDDISIFFAHRRRTRSLARIETQQQQEQQEQEQQQPEEEAQHQEQEGLNGSPPQTRLGEWRPSIVIGSPLWLEGEDPSAIEIADRKVAQRRLLVDHYPGTPYLVQMLQEAIQEREQLDETAEINTQPRSVVAQTKAISQRLEHLRIILRDSEFPPERANIEAAIDGYESGAIPCSNSYTLIWAGRVVDRCPNFASFTADRSARLERYLADHGPGWLWYEPPLSSGSGGTILAKKGICLENKLSWRHNTEDMGHYRVRMGFRRRKARVALDHRYGDAHTPKPRRRPSLDTHRSPRTPRSSSKPSRVPTVPDPDGPLMLFDTLVDSGATLPCLFERDMLALRIHPAAYAAQSSRMIATADSLTHLRVYELDVGVCVDQGGGRGRVQGGGGSLRRRRRRRSVVRGVEDLGEGEDEEEEKEINEDEDEDEDEDDEPTMLGTSTIPVVAFPGHPSHDDRDGGNPDLAPDRLSGLLPFHVCYLSSAPGNYTMWLGEDRRDVLGARRMPGQRRGPAAGVRVDVDSVGEEDDGRRKKRRTATTTPTTPSRSHNHQQQHQRAWLDDPDLQTPTRIVFEHEPPDGTGRVLRDEDVAGRGSAITVVDSSGPGTGDREVDTSGAGGGVATRSAKVSAALAAAADIRAARSGRERKRQQQQGRGPRRPSEVGR